jgi:hypothetical protein
MRASFTFSATEVGSNFECQIDSNGFTACSSPKTYSGLASGQTHTFDVRATDPAGNTDPTPATYSWLIVPKPSLVGVYQNGVWYLDKNGNGVWDGTPTDTQYSFGGGVVNAIPVIGDWTGDGKTKIGIYVNGVWYLDLNGNGVWDEAPTDAQYTFGGGVVNAIPVTGDWTGDGKTKIGLYANGVWYLDLNGNGVWDGTPTDAQYSFGGGVVNAIPVTGDWTGDGKTRIGIYADGGRDHGVWYFDLNGNGIWDGTSTDGMYNNFGGGVAGGWPVSGAW